MKKRSLKFLDIRRKIILVIIVIFCLISAIFLIFRRQYHGLELVFIDVGQGDSSLIKTPGGRTILIDGGPDNRVLRGLGKNLPFYRRSIDFLIISHYHDDHITGLIETIKRYRVKNLVYSGKIPDSLLISELLNVASQNKVKLTPLNGQANLPLGSNCDLNLLNPVILGIKDDSNNSITIRLDCLEKSFLFAGDNNDKVEAALLAFDWPLKADIFKASHHGSNTSNSASFLEKIAPRLIVVSVGANNRFGHPGSFFMDRAAALGLPIKRTDIDGDQRIFIK